MAKKTGPKKKRSTTKTPYGSVKKKVNTKTGRVKRTLYNSEGKKTGSYTTTERRKKRVQKSLKKLGVPPMSESNLKSAATRWRPSPRNIISRGYLINNKTKKK